MTLHDSEACFVIIFGLGGLPEMLGWGRNSERRDSTFGAHDLQLASKLPEPGPQRLIPGMRWLEGGRCTVERAK